MSVNQPFSDPILTQRRKGTADDPFLDILEEVYVSQSKAVLTEIPYKIARVAILEQTGGVGGTDTLDGGSFSNTTTYATETIVNPVMYEITDGSPSVNQYVVDYIQGVITFNVAQEGAKFLVHYKGQGYHYYPSSRVSYQQNLDGSITTIKQILDSSTTTINNIQSSIDNANTAATNANQATANYQTLLDQQKIVYKQSVATFADIATTYPTPALGWRVVAKDTGLAYRYDGTAWIEVDMSTTGEGFSVTISDAAPANVNVLWLNVPNVNQTTKVVQSSTAPADTSVIWWEP